jgi:hypothetical protein
MEVMSRTTGVRQTLSEGVFGLVEETTVFPFLSCTMMIPSPSFLLLVLSLLVTASATSSSSIPQGGGGRSDTVENNLATTTYWEEEIPPPPSDKDTSTNKKKKKDYRPLFWTPENNNVKQKRLVKTPHPMRTNKWELRFTTRNRKLFANRTLEMDFDDELGYCKAGTSSEGEAAAVGKWHMIPSGVLWRYSDHDDDTASSSRLLHFTAEIHLNPFGDHPRMLRGVVVRDRYVI